MPLFLIRPQPLVRIPEPFSDRNWLFELKLDGFRALAYCHEALSRYGEGGMLLRELQILAGHASPTTTMRYEHVEQWRLSDAMERARTERTERIARQKCSPDVPTAAGGKNLLQPALAVSASN